MPTRSVRLARPFALATCLFIAAFDAHAAEDGELRRLVDRIAAPLMEEHGVPGLAVAIVDGPRSLVMTYGVTEPGGTRPVDERTIFEIGSLSKPFTATLGAYAEATGALDMAAGAGTLMPELAGTPAGAARMIDLATYAAGGLPLQFPDDVVDRDDMVAFYRAWVPDHAPSRTRLYSNPSIGLFGHLAGRALGADFAQAMERALFPAFGLSDTFVTVPPERKADYAFGLSRDGRTVRVNPGMFDAEAYGIKTTAADLARFLQLNLDPSPLSEAWQAAVTATQTPRYRVGPMMQALGWEAYPWPVAHDDLREGNAPAMAFEPQEVRSSGAEAGVPLLFNKTGSTGGFGAYALFVPQDGIAIALLANRNLPIPARIDFALAILSSIGSLE